MKKSWIVIGIVVVAILAVTLILTQTEKELREIEIGSILPLTGDGATLGVDCKKGIDLAVNVINTNGGIQNKTVKILYEDSQGKPEPAVNALNKLIRADKVKIVIGDLFSAPTLAMAPIANRNKILLFSPGASNPRLSGMSKYVFRNYPSDNFEGKLIAHYIFAKLSIKNIAVLYPNNDYGKGLYDVFKKEFQALGGNLVSVESYDDEDTDFRTQLTKIKESKPNGLYLPGYYDKIALIARQAREMGINIQMFSNIAVEDPKIFEIGGDAVDGVIYTAPAIDFQSQDSVVRTFVQAYQETYGTDPGFPAAHGYDTAMVLFHVMGKYGFDPDDIREGLNRVENFHGVTGTISFDENGDVIKPFFIKRIEDKKFVKKEEYRI